MRDVLRKWFACGNTDLFLHQIASVNLLRDGVLDLDASVHLDKKEMAVLIDQELDCSRVFVPDRLGQLNGSVSHFLRRLAVTRGDGHSRSPSGYAVGWN